MHLTGWTSNPPVYSGCSAPHNVKSATPSAATDTMESAGPRRYIARVRDAARIRIGRRQATPGEAAEAVALSPKGSKPLPHSTPHEMAPVREPPRGRYGATLSACHNTSSTDLAMGIPDPKVPHEERPFARIRY